MAASSDSDAANNLSKLAGKRRRDGRNAFASKLDEGSSEDDGLGISLNKRKRGPRAANLKAQLQAKGGGDLATPREKKPRKERLPREEGEEKKPARPRRAPKAKGAKREGIDADWMQGDDDASGSDAGGLLRRTRGGAKEKAAKPKVESESELDAGEEDLQAWAEDLASRKEKDSTTLRTAFSIKDATLAIRRLDLKCFLGGRTIAQGGRLLFDDENKVNLHFLIGTYAEVKKARNKKPKESAPNQQAASSSGAPADKEYSYLKWLVKQAKGLRVVDKGEVRRGKIFAKRVVLAKRSGNFSLSVEANLVKGDGEAGEEDYMVEARIPERQRPIPREKNSDEAREQWKTHVATRKNDMSTGSSLDLSAEKVKSMLDAPELSFDWEHKDASDSEGGLEVDIPVTDIKMSKRDLFRTQLQRSMSFKQGKKTADRIHQQERKESASGRVPRGMSRQSLDSQVSESQGVPELGLERVASAGSNEAGVAGSQTAVGAPQSRGLVRNASTASAQSAGDRLEVAQAQMATQLADETSEGQALSSKGPESADREGGASTAASPEAAPPSNQDHAPVAHEAVADEAMMSADDIAALLGEGAQEAAGDSAVTLDGPMADSLEPNCSSSGEGRDGAVIVKSAIAVAGEGAAAPNAEEFRAATDDDIIADRASSEMLLQPAPFPGDEQMTQDISPSAASDLWRSAAPAAPAGEPEVAPAAELAQPPVEISPTMPFVAHPTGAAEGVPAETTNEASSTMALEGALAARVVEISPTMPFEAAPAARAVEISPTMPFEGPPAVTTAEISPTMPFEGAPAIRAAEISPTMPFEEAPGARAVEISPTMPFEGALAAKAVEISPTMPFEGARQTISTEALAAAATNEPADSLLLGGSSVQKKAPEIVVEVAPLRRKRGKHPKPLSEDSGDEAFDGGVAAPPAEGELVLETNDEREREFQRHKRRKLREEEVNRRAQDAKRAKEQRRQESMSGFLAASMMSKEDLKRYEALVTPARSAGAARTANVSEGVRALSGGTGEDDAADLLGDTKPKMARKPSFLMKR